MEVNSQCTPQCDLCCLPTAPQELIAHHPTILRLVTPQLGSEDKRALRQVCQAAKVAVDLDVTRLDLCWSSIGAASGLWEWAQWHTRWPNVERLHLRSITADTQPSKQLLHSMLTDGPRRWRLKSLGLGWLGEAPSSAFALLATQHFDWPFLEVLSLSICGLTEEHLADLSCLHASKLRHLDLTDSQHLVGGIGLDALAAAEWPQLHRLTLPQCPALDVPAAITLASSFASLRVLDLSRLHLSADAMGALCAAEFPNVQQLLLTHCGLDAPPAHLTTARWLPGLHALDLSCNTISIEHVVPILATVRLPNLRSLNLASNVVGSPNALEALLHADWPALATLCLSHLKISHSVQCLVHAQLPALTHLIMRNCGLWRANVEELAVAPWPQLQRLDLGGEQGVAIRVALETLELPLRFGTHPELKELVLKPPSYPPNSHANSRKIDRRLMKRLHELRPALVVLTG